MSSRREKLLQKIDPKLLEITPKLSSNTNSIIHLDSDKDTLKTGAKELMLRFYKQKLCLKSTLTNDGIEISDRESYELCKSISKRLSLPFSCENDFKLERPGKKYQDLKKKLEEEMSIKRKEEYDKRIIEYNKWKEEQKAAEKEDEEEEVEEKEEEEEEVEEKEEEEEEEVGEKEKEEEEEVGEKEEEEEEVGEKQKEEEEEEEEVEEKEKEEGVEKKERQMEKRNSELNDGTLNDKSDEIRNGNSKIEGADAHTSACVHEYNLTKNGQENKMDIATNRNDSVEEDKDDENYADKCSFIPPYQSAGEVLSVISQQTEYSQDLPLNLLPSSLTFNFSDSQASKISHDTLSQDSVKDAKNSNFFSERYKLFSNSQNPSNSFDLTEAYELCSGKFPGEEDSCQKPEQNLEEEDLSFWVDQDCSTDEDMKKNLNDNTNMKHRNSIKPKKRIIVFEDSDDENIEELEQNREDELKSSTIASDDEIDSNKSFKSKKKKVQQGLNFSDDDDDDDDDEESCKESEDDSDENFDERSVHYDSEENEIIHPKDFIEGEAELSGSEFSGDEDEGDLDVFDEEAGDEDVVDKNKVLSELKQIHLRWSLDEDLDKIRRLQEIYLEDGDLHTDKNQKKFRWKNLAKFEEEQTTIFEEDEKNETGDSSGDECSEELEVRKERLAKLLQFEKMKEKGESFLSYDLFQKIFRASKQTIIEDGTKTLIHDRDKVNNSTALAGASILVNSSTVNNCRGSFLRRDEEVLLRLAKVTATVNDNVRGPQNSKNFVFATKSPEKTEPENQKFKRSTEESEIQRCKKKLRLGVVPSDSIPSILDLWDK